MIHLEKLINDKDANNRIIEFNKHPCPTKDIHSPILNFETEYGAICGTNEAILIEESLEELFTLNEIKILMHNNNELVLSQEERRFTIPVFITTAGSSTPSNHCDFREIVDITEVI